MTATATQPNATKPQEFVRPFPALTPAQRYHFEVFGYVVVPNVFTPEECERMRSALRRLRDELRAQPDPMKAKVRGAHLAVNQPHHAYMGTLYEADDAFLEYACHPRIVGMAEEIMGCEARFSEFNAHINSRDPNGDFSNASGGPQFGFHHGVDIPFGSHIGPNGLYHCNFVKCLTNLTDLDPDDGGTVVVAGSHKCMDYAGAIQAAYEDRSLIHQVIAPAGSTLLFAETLIHATGQIRSDKERAIIIIGFAPRMYMRWDGAAAGTPPFSDELIARVPPELRQLFFGTAHWDRKAKYRKLTDPIDPRTIEPVKWDA